MQSLHRPYNCLDLHQLGNLFLRLQLVSMIRSFQINLSWGPAVVSSCGDTHVHQLLHFHKFASALMPLCCRAQHDRCFLRAGRSSPTRRPVSKCNAMRSSVEDSPSVAVDSGSLSFQRSWEKPIVVCGLSRDPKGFSSLLGVILSILFPS